MIDGCFLEISQLLVNYAQIDMRQELASHVRYIFMLEMVLNGIGVISGISLCHFLVVDAYAVVG